MEVLQHPDVAQAMAAQQVRELLERLQRDAAVPQAVPEVPAAIPDPPVAEVGGEPLAEPVEAPNFTKQMTEIVETMIRNQPLDFVAQILLLTLAFFVLFPRAAYAITSILFLTCLWDEIVKYNSKIASLPFDKQIPQILRISTVALVQILSMRYAYGL